jgi:hypothetical protein
VLQISGAWLCGLSSVPQGSGLARLRSSIIIPGLPTTLIGHIILKLSIASLFGIRVLTEAGCMVKFDKKKCVVRYNGKIILIGMKIQ